MIKRHKPQKQVIKAMEAVRRYCKHNSCKMCPYTINNGCMFDNNPQDKFTEEWIENAKKEADE